MESSGFNKKKSAKMVVFLSNVEATLTQLSIANNYTNDFQEF